MHIPSAQTMDRNIETMTRAQSVMSRDMPSASRFTSPVADDSMPVIEPMYMLIPTM